MITTAIAFAAALSAPQYEAAERLGATPEWVAWRDCVMASSAAMANGPDAADLVARAALRSCQDQEVELTRAGLSLGVFDPGDEQVYEYHHQQMIERAIWRIVQHRACRALARGENISC